MDAFSVSIADSFFEKNMSKSRMSFIAEPAIPWIALVLLVYIGGKMLLEKEDDDSAEAADIPEGADAIYGHVRRIAFSTLLVQGIATSIDALSVGFTIAGYGLAASVTASVIIGLVTFIICFSGLNIGQILGSRMKGKANKLGGIILIFIGIEIFLKSFI